MYSFADIFKNKKRALFVTAHSDDNVFQIIGLR